MLLSLPCLKKKKNSSLLSSPAAALVYSFSKIPWCSQSPLRSPPRTLKPTETQLSVSHTETALDKVISYLQIAKSNGQFSVSVFLNSSTWPLSLKIPFLLWFQDITHFPSDSTGHFHPSSLVFSFLWPLSTVPVTAPRPFLLSRYANSLHDRDQSQGFKWHLYNDLQTTGTKQISPPASKFTCMQMLNWPSLDAVANYFPKIAATTSPIPHGSNMLLPLPHQILLP